MLEAFDELCHEDKIKRVEDDDRLATITLFAAQTDLQDASSVAGLLVTTEAMVAERPKKDLGSPTMPGGGMGGMDY